MPVNGIATGFGQKVTAASNTASSSNSSTVAGEGVHKPFETHKRRESMNESLLIEYRVPKPQKSIS